MKRRKRIGLMVLAGVLSLVIGVASLTAQGKRKGGEGRKGMGERRGFDLEEMRQRLSSRLQEMLGASDDEWQVIYPRIQKITEARGDGGRGSMFGAMMTFGGMDFGRGRGGSGGKGPGGKGPESPEPGGFFEESKEVAALAEALESPDTPTEEIQSKLEAVRKARKREEAELQEAREALREVLTLRQEAQLVLLGVLD